eukprot:m.509319 g.509319  ORF g.509319 m.509319 type:complete len:381 (+) comp57400_c0_seq3:3-1145(+)
MAERIARLKQESLRTEVAPWLHPAMSRAEADRILAQFGNAPGLFLVRVKDASKGAYVLSMVVGAGQTIHHLLERAPGGNYLLNGQPWRHHTTLVELIHEMRTPAHDWLIPLMRPVTILMMQNKPDPGYEKMWEAQEDDLYIVQEGQEQTLPARAQALDQPQQYVADSSEQYLTMVGSPKPADDLYLYNDNITFVPSADEQAPPPRPTKPTALSTDAPPPRPPPKQPATTPAAPLLFEAFLQKRDKSTLGDLAQAETAIQQGSFVRVDQPSFLELSDRQLAIRSSANVIIDAVPLYTITFASVGSGVLSDFIAIFSSDARQGNMCHVFRLVPQAADSTATYLLTSIQSRLSASQLPMRSMGARAFAANVGLTSFAPPSFLQ